jgi:DNA replication initiation complex subunit (GINS family)
MPDQYTLLLEWRRSEGATRGLAKLPLDFYRTTTNYLAEVRRTYEEELRENPSGRKGELARQTHQRASQVARDLIEARMTKILSQAFQASVGGIKELPNALPEEHQLFDSLVGVMRSYRSLAAPFLDPGATAAPTAAPRLSPAAPAAPPAPAAARPPAAAPMRFVRVLKDSPPVAVGSETLELHKEDLLNLPQEVAQILIDSKIAEPVDARAPTI